MSSPQELAGTVCPLQGAGLATANSCRLSLRQTNPAIEVTNALSTRYAHTKFITCSLELHRTSSLLAAWRLTVRPRYRLKYVKIANSGQCSAWTSQACVCTLKVYEFICWHIHIL